MEAKISIYDILLISLLSTDISRLATGFTGTSVLEQVFPRAVRVGSLPLPLTLMEIVSEPDTESGLIWKQRQLPLATEKNQSCQ